MYFADQARVARFSTFICLNELMKAKIRGSAFLCWITISIRGKLGDITMKRRATWLLMASRPFAFISSERRILFPLAIFQLFGQSLYGKAVWIWMQAFRKAHKGQPFSLHEANITIVIKTAAEMGEVEEEQGQEREIGSAILISQGTDTETHSWHYYRGYVVSESASQFEKEGFTVLALGFLTIIILMAHIFCPKLLVSSNYPLSNTACSASLSKKSLDLK